MHTELKDGKLAIYARNRKEWRRWLEAAAEESAEMSVWLILYHKKSKTPCVNLEEATEEALCFGWIDSLCKSRDAESYYRTFSPRRPTSKWSKKNRERAARMIAAGQMTAYGQAVIDRSKQKGTWLTDA